MQWLVLFLSLIGLLTSQASSYPQQTHPIAYRFSASPQAADATDVVVAKRALMILSRLAPIRALLEQDDKQAEPRNYIPRSSPVLYQRPPGGPMRWGRRR